MALFHGLCLAQEEEAIPRLKCYSDSMLALALVRDDGGELHRYAALIRSIRDLLALDWDVDLIPLLREGNSSADFVAKLGVTQEDQISSVRTSASWDGGSASG